MVKFNMGFARIKESWSIFLSYIIHIEQAMAKVGVALKKNKTEVSEWWWVFIEDKLKNNEYTLKIHTTKRNNTLP